MEKKFLRKKDNSVIAGVCSGIADYFDLNPSRIRIAWLISILFFGTGLLLYIILVLIIPKQDIKLDND